MNVAVIGAGIMGASAALALAKRDRHVTVYDTQIPYPRGSSYGDARLFRMAYFEHPDYVPLLRASIDGWRDLESRSGSRLFHQVGALYIGQPAGDLIRGSLLSAIEHDLPFDSLTETELAHRFPQFAPPPGSVGFLDQMGGYVLATASVSATLAAALRLGGRLKTQEVLDLEGTTVVTADGEQTYDRVIVCAGPWSGRFLESENLGLKATRQVVSWTPSAGFDDLPVFGLEDPDGQFWYGIPNHPSAPGVKFACHTPGETVASYSFEPDADPEEDDAIRPARERWIPGLRGEVSLRACLYTMSPDGFFRLGFVSGNRSVSYAAGFSGHGFKFGPAIGEVLADMAEIGAVPQRAEFLANR